MSSSSRPDVRISLGVHIGLAANLPLLRNLLASFEACNTHPSVELLLVDTSGDESVRGWMRDYMSRTARSTRQLSVDMPSGAHRSTCYMQALRETIDAAGGRFFAFMAEDNQFTVTGGALESMERMLLELGPERSIVHLFGQQSYKFMKPNNRFAPVRFHGGLGAFEIENTKWCPFALCERSAYSELGEFPISDEATPHATVDWLSARARALGFKRYYPLVPAGAWFPNGFNGQARELCLRLQAEDPDGLLLRLMDLDETERFASQATLPDGTPRPLGAEDFIHASGLM